MKRALSMLLMSSLCAMAEAPKRSGHATAQWLVGNTKFGDAFADVEWGGFIHTVIRLQVDDPWHVYWLNPGESGMATSLELKMPEGWQHLGLSHPIPKKFKTGELPGFGHEGTVDYVLALLAPNDFKGNAEFEANVSWLTCNDDACIPGEMQLKLKFVGGKPVGAKLDPQAVKSASEKLPLRIGDELKLTLRDGGKHWDLRLEGETEFLGGTVVLDPSKAEVFVETQELVSASADVKFRKIGDHWEAKALKGEFAQQKPDECALLLVEKGKRAVRVEWKRE